MKVGELCLIFWETTRACNLSCPHCRAQAESSRSPLELKTDEIKRIIDQISSFSKPIFVFSGGEPLLRDDIYELALYADRAGLKPALATNATLIDKRVAGRLKKSEIKVVSVSIYGSDRESHNEFCGEKSAFEKTLEGIGNLRDAGLTIQINATITKKNLHLLEAIGDFALRQGASAYHVFFLVPVGRGKYIGGDQMSPEEYEEALNRLYDLEMNLPLRIKATCAPHYYRVLRQRTAKDRKKLSFEPQGFSAMRKGCLAGGGVSFISYKGEVFGCGYLPIAAGDLKKEDFKSIWFDSELFRVLRDESNLKGRCGICEFKKICGGCRARALAATGNYLEEEPECTYQPFDYAQGRQ